MVPLELAGLVVQVQVVHRYAETLQRTVVMVGQLVLD